MKRIQKIALGSFLFALSSSPAFAQTAPDAGQVLQDLKPSLQAPAKDTPLSITKDEKESEDQNQETKIKISGITFEGNKEIQGQELYALLDIDPKQSYSLSQLKGFADKITAYYREKGYIFAKAYLPAQKVANETLTIKIVEGRYGIIKTSGKDEKLAQAAQPYLAPLEKGAIISNDELERATLILSDLPGIKTAPVVRPGQEIGTGDLDIKVAHTPSLAGSISFDNYGNRYTGEYRGTLNLSYDSPFMLGDQITLTGLGSDEATWVGSIGYSMPLGTDGLRLKLSYFQTNYSLGKQFSNLDAIGFAKVSAVGLSYPFVRSQTFNLYGGITFQHKDLEDKQEASDSTDKKYSDALPVSLTFDYRDNLGRGGLTYGTISWTHGALNLDADLKSTDMTTAQTAGAFDKFNLDIARFQLLPADFILFTRFSGQLARDNLDSSEGFGLGGSNGVRAYPLGEAYGDEGWLGQIELRYPIEAFTPFAFYDLGGIAVNHANWDNSKNNQTIAGPGFGVRMAYGRWTMETYLAWRTQGGKPQSDTMDKSPRWGFSAGATF